MTIDHISYKITYVLYLLGKPSVFINGVNILSEPSDLTMKLLDQAQRNVIKYNKEIIDGLTKIAYDTYEFGF